MATTIEIVTDRQISEAEAQSEPSSDVESLTPDQAWERYVGDQSPEEFLGFAGDGDGDLSNAAAHCREYVGSVEICSALSGADRAIVAAKLADHIAEAQSEPSRPWSCTPYVADTEQPSQRRFDR